MMKLFGACALFSLWTGVAWPAAAAPLTSLHAIHVLSNAEASHSLPVEFQATVGYSRGYENLLFVQDGDDAIFVRPPGHLQLTPGDRILVKGVTQGSFRPIVQGEIIELIRHGELPKPLATTFEELINAKHDSMVVSFRAKVRSADLVASQTPSGHSGRLQLLADSGHLEADVDSDDESALRRLLDDDVELTAVAAGKFDNKMQVTGVVLYVAGLKDIRVLKPAGASPWSLPVTGMDKILAGYQMHDLSPRVRVHGTITYYRPGSAVVLQEGSKSLWLSTHTLEPLQVGDEADATGFPDAHDRLLTLTDATIQDTHIFAPVIPQTMRWLQLGFWSSNKSEGHQNDLVSIEGRVAFQVREAEQDEYVLESDGRLLSAIYHHPVGGGPPAPIVRIPMGSIVRVTGICVVSDPTDIVPGAEVPFNILLGSPGDVVVVANPSLLNVRNLSMLAGLLFAAVLVVGARGWLLERQVRRQTAAMAGRIEAEAALERRRSAILEDINGSRPLAEVLEEITKLVSFSLHGAPAWCEISNGARLGDHPKDQGLRILRKEIPARSGPALGTIFAGLDERATGSSEPSADESEALSLAAGLATLAIETRHLYSDLLHRSEFDLLTDIHNRFSLDRCLEAQIEQARLKASIFGLIYIDLDDFKQVNDRYGHKIGDLFLQDVSQRMKRQLRSVDMLARLGGDEFAVLVGVVRSRADVEEIASRLERCFDDPFAVEGYILRGSASVGIAIYPEDARTKDTLLTTADAYMYVAKNARKRRDPAICDPSDVQSLQDPTS
jgi:diguanylate cyclase (GGDEF)-like protein